MRGIVDTDHDGSGPSVVIDFHHGLLGMFLTHFGLLSEDVDLGGEAELVARLEAGRKRAAGKR